VEDDAFALANCSGLFDREQHASLVVRPHDRRDGCVRSDRFFEEMQIERAVRFNRQKRDFAALLLQKLAEVDIRGMLDGRGDDVPLSRMQCQRAVNRRVVALSAAAREDDLLGLRVDQSCDFCAGFVDVFADLAAELVGAGRVAPKLAQKRHHGVDHFGSDPRGGVVIEVTEFLLSHGFWRQTGQSLYPLKRVCRKSESALFLRYQSSFEQNDEQRDGSETLCGVADHSRAVFTGCSAWGRGEDQS
jgi:hypothetical protein